MGVHVTTVSHRAAQDRWETVDYRHARIRRALADVAELSRRIRAGDEPDPVDRAEKPEAGGIGADEPAAAQECWPDEPPAARIARIGAVLTRHTETMLRRVEAGQPLESRQVAALSGLVALAERMAAITRQDETREEAQGEEEVAETLRVIDRRIVYLARCEARRLAVSVFGIPQEEVDARLPEPAEK